VLTAPPEKQYGAGPRLESARVLRFAVPLTLLTGPLWLR
jgi:hypothetical protein